MYEITKKYVNLHFDLQKIEILSEFSDIRPFDDCEVSDVLIHLKNNPTMLKLLQFAFPKLSEEEQLQKLLSCKKIRNFQEQIMYPIIHNSIAKSVT